MRRASRSEKSSIALGEEQLLQIPLRALADNPSGSFWQRTVDGVSLWFE